MSNSATGTKPFDLTTAFEKVDLAALKATEKLAEAERQQIIQLFPSKEWPTMPKERYALGHPVSYCWWLEFGAKYLGSMKGGASSKMILYYSKTSGQWVYDKQYTSVEEAWEKLRGAFVQAFELAKAGQLELIDDLAPLAGGHALRTKTLYIYFPELVLPIYSSANMWHFLELLHYPNMEKAKGLKGIRLNRLLLAHIRQDRRFDGWSNWQIMWFLYTYFNPNEAARIVKITPGKEAQFWEECRAGDYICAGLEQGWDELGDLTAYENYDAYLQRFNELYLGKLYRDASTAKKKAREPWTLRELKAGDIVVAFKGTSEVLGVGEVTEDGYQWREERASHKHTVRVKWSDQFPHQITPQPAWGFVSVCDITPAVYSNEILKVIGKGKGGNDAKPIPIDAKLQQVFDELDEALESKGQAILYGPPGTGKTYTARQFALWFLTRRQRADLGKVLADEKLFKQVFNELTKPARAAKVPLLSFLTFHPSYTYEDFIEGYKPVASNAGSNGSHQPGGGLTLSLQDGVFKRICQAAAANPGQPYLVLIDEINRANIAKVFGELITLLEKDKRGMDVTLPQSRERFTIPENLFLLGTMNTADKSIKLLDAALRRRFAFKELMPDLKLLTGATINGLELESFLEELNRRIAKQEGREKQIGHSFLLEQGKPVAEPDEFARRFRQEILPLLQEYCYDDYSELAHYLGDKLVDKENQTLSFEVLNDDAKLIEALLAGYNGNAKGNGTGSGKGIIVP